MQRFSQVRNSVSLALLTVIVPITYAQTSPAGELPRKGWMGAQMGPNPEGGLKIVKVLPTGTAATGLQEGDVVQKLDGRELKMPSDVGAVFSARMPGKKIVANIVRNGKAEVIELTVVERVRDSNQAYTVEYGTVSVDNYRVRRIISRPSGPVTPRPTLFLIQGIGESTMDFALTGENPYAKLLKKFNDAGWITVRMEKPGIGDSEGGPFQSITWDADTKTFVNGFKSIAGAAGIDPNRIVIFGHSMGGVEGPMVAGQNKVAGVAVYGTGYRSWAEYFLENLRRQASMAGAKDGDVDDLMRGTAAANALILDLAMEPEAVKKQFPSLEMAVTANYPDGKSMSGMPISFWRGCYQTNIPALWDKVTCPVLAMWGESEFISSKLDHELIAAAANKRKPGSGTFLSIKNADHGFSNVATPMESLQKWGTPSPMQENFVTELLNWANSVVK